MRHTPISLDGAVVVITGAARGIGRETARAFLEQGARVAVCDLDEDAATITAKELGEPAESFAVNVTSRDSFAECLAAVRATMGSVDVMVNNAGIMPAGAFMDEPDDLTDAIFDVNVRGVITGTRLVIPEMTARGSGHIVNIASLLGKVQIPGLATYVASKHAVVGLGKALRPELAGTGVSLTTVLPPVVNTQLSSGMPMSGVLTRVLKVEPEQIAEAVVRSLDHRPAEIAVPRWLGAYPVIQPFIPPIVENTIRRLAGDDTALHGVDHVGRAAYDERLARVVDTNGRTMPMTDKESR